MRSIEYYIILTADGMYADADGGLDYWDPADDEHRYANELLRTAGTEVLGRKIYDGMTYWDQLDIDDPATPEVGAEFARYWRETPKLVVSRGDPELGPNATKLEGDVVETLRALKATDGPPIAVGAGADLFATLAEAGLIDKYRWLVIPKAIGQGKSVFASLTRPLDLRLVGTRTFESGAILLEYEPNERRPPIS